MELRVTYGVARHARGMWMKNLVMKILEKIKKKVKIYGEDDAGGASSFLVAPDFSGLADEPPDDDDE